MRNPPKPQAGFDESSDQILYNAGQKGQNERKTNEKYRAMEPSSL